MRLIALGLFTSLILTVNSQNIKLDIRMVKEHDSNRSLIVTFLSDSSCFINLETGYLGLTNSLDELYLEVLDSTQYSLNINGGGIGHWYAPLIEYSDVQNDSLEREIRKRFLESKMSDGAISNVKNIFLYKNQPYITIYKLKFDETHYFEGVLSTQAFYYELKRNNTYYLRLSYTGGGKGEVENGIKIYKGKVLSNYLKFIF